MDTCQAEYTLGEAHVACGSPAVVVVTVICPCGATDIPLCAEHRPVPCAMLRENGEPCGEPAVVNLRGHDFCAECALWGL